MTEFALFIDRELKEFREFEETPEDIPHKKAKWLRTVREFGEPFEGIENFVYMIRTRDPATLPQPVPPFITRRQLAHTLANREEITHDEAIEWAAGTSLPATLVTAIASVPDPAAAFDMTMLVRGATEFYRDHPMTAVVGSLFSKTNAELDEIWREGAVL